MQFCISYSYHPELRGDQGGVLHSSIVGQDAVREPAEQHSLKWSAGVELQKVEDKYRESRRERGSGQEWSVTDKPSSTTKKWRAQKRLVSWGLLLGGKSHAWDNVWEKSTISIKIIHPCSARKQKQLVSKGVGCCNPGVKVDIILIQTSDTLALYLTPNNQFPPFSLLSSFAFVNHFIPHCLAVSYALCICLF